MAETLEKKKKIYKLATELNLSHETLVDFLRKKGHEVKNHMSSVDAEMMRDILVHFKREKDSAEKHQRKMAEIKESKKKAEKKPEEVAPAPVIVQQPAVASTEETVTPPVEEVAPAEEKGVPEQEQPVTAGEEAQPAEALDTEPEAPAEQVPEAEEAVEEKSDVEEPLSPLELKQRAKVGLTIKGKIDLKPRKTVAKRAAAPGTPAEQGPGVPESEDAHRKKKKKKKLREEIIESKGGEVDELDRKKKKKKKLRHKEIDQAEVNDAIRRTFAAMDDSAVTGRAILRKRKKKEREEEELRIQQEAELEKGTGPAASSAVE